MNSKPTNEATRPNIPSECSIQRRRASIGWYATRQADLLPTPPLSCEEEEPSVLSEEEEEEERPLEDEVLVR